MCMHTRLWTWNGWERLARIKLRMQIGVEMQLAVPTVASERMGK